MALLLILLAAVVAWFWYQTTAAAVAPASGASDVTSTPATASDPLSAMAQAIYQFEGGGKPGATNSWNNNPGNIGGGQATFPSFQAGWDALLNYIQSHVSQHPDWTFTNFFSYYLTGNAYSSSVTNQGDPVSYASYVANSLGTTPDVSVSSVLGGN